MSLLAVNDLRVSFQTERGVVRAVDGISFTLEQGRTLAIVGESGSGKSAASRALLGLAGGTVSGSVTFDGRELLTSSKAQWRDTRGKGIAMIFQDPLSALHPFFTVGNQIGEAYLAHSSASRKQARARAIEMLDLVGIPSPEKRVDQYPHEFSGGMRQRVVIAMALITSPKLLIADEPTTALDVTVQAQIMALLRRLQRELGTSILLITHDLGVVASAAHEVLVMYAGRAAEQAPVSDMFAEPQHPYTLGLLASIPKLNAPEGVRLRPIPGSPPSLVDDLPGCAFQARCPHRFDRCVGEQPLPTPIDQGGEGRRHLVSCHLEVATRRGLAAQQQGKAPFEQPGEVSAVSP